MRKKSWKVGGKVELLPTRDCEAGYSNGDLAGEGNVEIWIRCIRAFSQLKNDTFFRTNQCFQSLQIIEKGFRMCTFALLFFECVCEWIFFSITTKTHNHPHPIWCATSQICISLMMLKGIMGKTERVCTTYVLHVVCYHLHQPNYEKITNNNF